MKGTVKKFNDKKGFGFITGEDSKDYFFHYSALVMDNYKTVADGDAVEFDVEETDRGLRAVNIVKN